MLMIVIVGTDVLECTYSYLHITIVTMLDLLNSPPCDIHYTAACFVTYLSHLKKRNGEPIDSKTINSYVSHVVYRLVNTGIIDSPDEFRCPSTTRLVAAIKRRDGHIHRPLRETISISLYHLSTSALSLLLMSFRIQ
jgi:hypothetical protein